MQQEARQRDSSEAANPLLLGAASVLVIHEVIPVGASREYSGIKLTLVLASVASGQNTGPCNDGFWVQFLVKGSCLSCRFDPQPVT